MEIQTLLRRIDLRLAQLDRTEAEVSRRATGSPDTIRNWRRRAKQSDDPGVSVKKLEAVAEELGVTPRWLQGEGSEDYDERQKRRDELLAMFDGLPNDHWEALALQSVRGVAETASEAERAASPRRKVAKQPR